MAWAGRIVRFAAFLALAPLILFALLVALLLRPFTRPIEMTPAEAIAYLRAFLDGTDEWAYDDFTAMRIADPRLETIRLRAIALDLPASEEDVTTLIAEIETLA